MGGDHWFAGKRLRQCLYIAAAVLFALNRLTAQPLAFDRLLAVAASLGADVPFCLTGGTMLAEGIGDRLSSLPAMKRLPIVIVKPPFCSSTAEAYAAIDRCEVFHPSCEAAVAALQSGNLSMLISALGNSFESVIEPQQIAAIKQRFLQCGALGSAMSGSGSAVFGIFDSPFKAEQCRAELAEEIGPAFLTLPASSGIEIHS